MAWWACLGQDDLLYDCTLEGNVKRGPPSPQASNGSNPPSYEVPAGCKRGTSRERVIASIGKAAPGLHPKGNDAALPAWWVSLLFVRRCTE